MSRSPELIDDDVPQGYDDDLRSVELIAPPSRFPNIVRFAVAFLGIVLLFLLSVWVLPRVAPGSWTVGPVERVIQDLVGVQVEIRGDHSVALLPSIRITAQNVVHRAAEGVPEHFSVAEIDVGLSALALITGSIDVNRLAMIGPVWSLLAPTDEETISEPPPVHVSWGAWRDMHIDDLSLVDGRVIFGRDINGVPIDVRSINVSLSPSPGNDEGLSLAGVGELRGQQVRLEIVASDPQLFVSGNRWPLRMLLETDVFKVEFDGALAVRERVQGEFRLQVSSSNDIATRTMLGWPAGVGGAASFDLSSIVRISGNSFNFDNIALSSPRNAISGNLVWRGAFTQSSNLDGIVEARQVVIDDADFFHLLGLMPYLPTTNVEVSWRQATMAAQVLGAGQMSIIRAYDGESVSLDIGDTRALGGMIRGTASIDRSEGMLAVHVEGKALNVDAESLVATKDMIIDPPLRGPLTVDVNLFTIGATRDQLLAAINGTAEVLVNNGLLNIPQLTDAAGLEAISDRGFFRSLNGLFQISHGVAKSEDLLLRTEGGNLIGRGHVDLAAGDVMLEIGRLGDADAGRGVERFLLSGSPGQFRVETVN